MVSIGSILGVVMAGAVLIGGYVAYRNLDKIGAAGARTIEGNLINPFGDWLDSVSKSFTSSNLFSQPAPQAPPQATGATYEEWLGGKDERTDEQIFDWYNQAGLTPPAYATPQPETTPYYPPTQVSPAPAPTPTVQPPSYKESYPQQPAPQSGASYDLEPTKAGYYYIDYEGSKFDTQWKLSSFNAANVAKAAAAEGDALFGIKYIGQSKLGEAGFKLFGESQNYL